MSEINIDKLDRAFLADITRNMSYTDKAKFWSNYKKIWFEGMEKAEHEWQRENCGRRAANTHARELMNKRKEIRGNV